MKITNKSHLSDTTYFIYVIKISKWKYVGSTKYPNTRKTVHKSLLNKGTHKNKYLQAAYNKYKEFEFSILQSDIPESIIKYVEDVYMSAMKTLNHDERGCNMRNGSESHIGMEVIEKMRASKTKVKVDIDKYLALASTSRTNNEIANELGVKRYIIEKLNRRFKLIRKGLSNPNMMLDENTKSNILLDCNNPNMKRKELLKKYNISKTLLRAFIQRNNLSLRTAASVHGKPFNKKKFALDFYTNTYAELSKKYDASFWWIWDKAKKLGLRKECRNELRDIVTGRYYSKLKEAV